jgi:hypothetical protein
MGVYRADKLRGRMKDLVKAVVSGACQAAALTCLACVACRTTVFAGEGGAGTTGGRREDMVVACILRGSEGLEGRNLNMLDGHKRSLCSRGHGLVGWCTRAYPARHEAQRACVPRPKRVDSIKPKVDAVTAKADDGGNAGKGAAKGAPIKVALVAGKEL